MDHNWNILWSQRLEGQTRTYTDNLYAATATDAVEQFARRGYRNARIDAVWRPDRVVVKVRDVAKPTAAKEGVGA